MAGVHIGKREHGGEGDGGSQDQENTITATQLGQVHGALRSGPGTSGLDRQRLKSKKVSVCYRPLYRGDSVFEYLVRQHIAGGAVRRKMRRQGRAADLNGAHETI